MKTATDLNYFANQIKLSAKKIHEQIEESGKAIDLPAKSLTKKIPALAALDPDTIVFRIGKFKDEFFAQTLTLYLSDEGIPGIYSPNLKLVSDVDFRSYKAGINGIINIALGGKEFICNFPMSQHHRDELREIGMVEGEGIPDVELIKSIPHPTHYWENLEKQEIYSVLRETSPDNDNYGSMRYMIADSKGTEFEVYECASLRQIIDQYGMGESFKISKISKKEKDGKSQSKVYLVALKSDFSDLSTS